MQDIDFTFDGVSAADVGIRMQSPFVFSPAVPRVQAIQLPGRNGDLHIDEGTYNNRTGTVECYALDDTFNAQTLKPNANVTGLMERIMLFLFQSTGYMKLQPSDDTGHYWYARVANAGAIQARLGLLNPFTIEFDCKPFRYTNNAETIISVQSGETLQNPTHFKAYPLLFVDASGTGTISNSYGSIDILEAGQYIIDCEDGRAVEGYTDGEQIYYSTTGADSKIHATSFPYFPSVRGGLTFSSSISLQLQPRWRTL